MPKRDESIASDLLINLSCLIDQPTGISNYALSLLPHLRSLHPILLISSPISGYTCLPIPPKLTPEAGIQGRLRRLYWVQFKLPKLFKQLKAKLIFSPLPEAPIATGSRFIVTIHDLIPLRFPKRFGPRTLYYRHWAPWVLHQAEHIICNSQSTANDLVDYFGIKTYKISPIPLAFDSACFRPDLSKVSTDSPYFLYIGHSEPYKNLPRLIQGFSEIYQKCTHQLWIAGTPERRYTSKLQAQIQALGIEERVKFLDYVPYDKLPILIAQATALVFPSLWEGFGLPVLEAMACGTPVITSNLASLPEVAGEAAILINPYNAAEIADAMNLIAQDGELRSQLRQAGFARVKQFSWQKTGQATVEVLQRFM